MNIRFDISLQGVGKKFYNRWLFKDITVRLEPGSQLALVGRNGSGKSTLMRIIAGQLSPTAGKIYYTRGKARITVERVFHFISWSGPHVALYPELSLTEHIRLHYQFKDCLLANPQDLVDILRLQADKDKPLRFYSSGMLQRVKVGLALFTKSEVLMLDEPTSNMDEDNARQILELIDKYLLGRTYILASNMEREFGRIEQVLRLP